MQTRIASLLVIATLALTAAACGSNEPCSGAACSTQEGTQEGTEDESSNTTYQGTCCLNGQYYSCSTNAAFELCAGSDPVTCHAGCGVTDIACHMRCDSEAMNAKHDPSQCTRDGSRDGECTTSPSTPDPTGCVGSSNGMACTYSSQCPSGRHCANGKCYSNGVGNPCTYSSECSSGNCTDGCCRGTSSGNACTYSSQCGSGLHCTGGKCYSGLEGNPCTYSSECTSNNCTNGRCQ